MKAWTIIKNGKPESAFELRDVNDPVPKDGEVRIAVEAFGLNYADVMARNGLYREAPPLPFVPGYEVVGKIMEAKNAALIGKRVLAFTRFGGYAEQVTTPEQAVVELEESVPAGAAVALGTQYVTAYHAAYEMVNLFEGDRVLIHAAAGGVGTALTQLARTRGCEIFGTASLPEKLEFMSSNGVHHPINYKEYDYESKVKEILGENRLDVAFNSIGGSTFKKDRRLIGTGGRQVLYGAAERSGKNLGMLSTLSFVWKMGLVIPIGLLMHSRGMIGVNMLKIADNKPDVLQRCMTGVVSLYRQGKIQPYVGGEFSADQLAEAHNLLESRDSIGKIVVKWE